MLAEFLGDEPHEVHHVLGLAGESCAERGVLGGDADGAGVQVALSEHDAAEGDEGDGPESELLGAQKCGHGKVAARAKLADDAAEVDPRRYLNVARNAMSERVRERIRFFGSSGKA